MTKPRSRTMSYTVQFVPIRASDPSPYVIVAGQTIAVDFGDVALHFNGDSHDESCDLAEKVLQRALAAVRKERPQ